MDTDRRGRRFHKSRRGRRGGIHRAPRVHTGFTNHTWQQETRFIGLTPGTRWPLVGQPGGETMMTTTITFDRIGRSSNVEPLILQGDPDAASIAEAVYKHASPCLRSRFVEVTINDQITPAKVHLDEGRAGTGTITIGDDQEEDQKPRCHACGAAMELRNPPGGWTPEQQFCGTWYDHPVTADPSLIGHASTVLHPSEELIQQIREQPASTSNSQAALAALGEGI